MRVRRGVMALLSLSPLLTLAAIAYVGRTQTLPWDFEEYSPVEAKVLHGYRQATRQSNELSRHWYTADQAEIEEALEAWLAASRKAGTASLPLISLTDQGAEGPKADLMLAKSHAVTAGLHLASDLSKQGRHKEASNLLLTSMNVAVIGRDGGFNCLIDSSRDLCTGLAMVGQIGRQLSPQERQYMLDEIAALNLDEDVYQAILDRMGRIARYRHQMNSDVGVIVANASSGALETLASRKTANLRVIYQAEVMDSNVPVLSRIADVQQQAMHRRLAAVFSELANP